MSRCRITVLKTCVMQDVAQKIGKEKKQNPCPLFKEGQIFQSQNPFGTAMPEGFCHTAWQALEIPVNVLAGGGKYLGLERRIVVSCSDGLRPVLFLVEPIEE